MFPEAHEAAVTGDRETVRAWSLVLASQGIEHRVERQEGLWQLVVQPGDATRAAQALAAYTWENAATSKPPPVRAGRVWAITPILVGALLLTFQAITGPWAEDSRWFAAGAAKVSAMRTGEIWRAVTALTLHADYGHAFANAVILALFGSAVCSIHGAGKGMALILMSGALGNLLNIPLRGSLYSGVGASTAVFAAAGLLVGTPLGTPGASSGRRRGALVAGILLLALLGMSEQSDVIAHVLGFVAGIGIGATFVRWRPGTLGARGQIAWALGAAAVVAASWALALSA